MQKGILEMRVDLAISREKNLNYFPFDSMIQLLQIHPQKSKIMKCFMHKVIHCIIF